MDILNPRNYVFVTEIFLCGFLKGAELVTVTNIVKGTDQKSRGNLNLNVISISLYDYLVDVVISGISIFS